MQCLLSIHGILVGYLIIVRVVAYNIESFLLQLGAVLGSTIEAYIGISFCIASYWEESLGIVNPVPGSYWNEPAVNGTGSLGPYE